jgi:hypothetical protein
MMDWTQLISPGLGTLGLIAGGIIAKRKPKADAHAVVVADAVAIASNANQRAEATNARLDVAMRRLDEMEDRENRRDELARQHLRWDWRQVRRLADLGIEVEDPPALFLYDEPTKGN